MTHGARFEPSHPGMDLWRPDGDHLRWSEAAWLGASVGVGMHAILSFFSAVLPSLEAVLVLFAPATRLAEGLTAGAAPLGQWFVLLLSQGFFWALVGVALLAAWRELVYLVRLLRGTLPNGT